MSSPTPSWHAFDDREAASRALARRVADDLARALNASQRAALVVSGGSSPIAFFRQLRGAELDWTKISIVPSDERRVAADHPDRNERMIRAELLQERAGAAELVSLIDPDSSAVSARLERLRPFAGVVLGMGEDGHTASLFPNAPEIGETLRSGRLCLTQEVPGLPTARVSLTPRALLDTPRVYLLLFGQAKKRVYEQALQAGRPEAFPVRVVLHQPRVPVDVYWAP